MYLVISFPGQRQEGTGNTGPYIKEQDSHFSRIPSRWWVENTYFISVVNSYGTRARTPSFLPQKEISLGFIQEAKGHLTTMIHFRDSPHPQHKPHVTAALDHRCKCGGVLFLLVSPLLTAFHGAQAP